jgi:hypothetical protein
MNSWKAFRLVCCSVVLMPQIVAPLPPIMEGSLVFQGSSRLVIDHAVKDTVPVCIRNNVGTELCAQIGELRVWLTLKQHEKRDFR